MEAENKNRFPGMSLTLNFLAGPAVFFLIWFIGIEGLSPAGHIALGTLAWQVTWWILQPVPWAITSLLVLAVFPLTQTMSIKETAGLFGQVLFFWIMGLTLMGYAIHKHGLAKRFALFFLTLPGVASNTARLIFFFMAATTCVSTILSDASSVAIMLPLGLALQSYMDSLASGTTPDSDEKAPQSGLGPLFVLAALYGAVAGGVATIVGMPHSPVALAQLETLTDRTIGWFQWMMVGTPTAVTLLICFYFLLRFFFRQEIGDIPGGREFLLGERTKLGKMTRGEKHVLFVFSVAVALFILPAMLPTFLGSQHPVAAWLRATVSIWVVPPIMLLLLFSLPVDLQKREFVLNWREAADRLPWHVLLLVTSATGLIDALADFGFMDLVSQSMTGLTPSRIAFPFLVSFTMAFSTNFIPGVPATAIFTAILIPVAQQIGFNPASITIAVPTSALGVIFPWAGSTTATAFGFGQISLKDLIKVGVVAELIIVIVVSTYCILFEPIL
jgi:solute carrier family 13 (sodium-dependent dicarboxylate transporter), member 2/3/5